MQITYNIKTIHKHNKTININKTDNQRNTNNNKRKTNKQTTNKT